MGGDLRIQYNDALTNLDGLVSVASVGGELYISSNNALTNLDGLANLASVGGQLYISCNGALTNLDGLANLTSVGGDLTIQYNYYALTNLDGLANLTSVGGDLTIQANYGATSCQGIAPVLGWPSGPPDDSEDGIITIDSNGGNACGSVSAVFASVSAPTSPLSITPLAGSRAFLWPFRPQQRQTFCSLSRVMRQCVQVSQR